MTENETGGVNKDKLAVALGYERESDTAPRVLAKGKGHIADQIIAIARAQGIEIREDRDLARLLALVDIDAPIPMEAYVAVAEILAYIYRKNAEMGQKS